MRIDFSGSTECFVKYSNGVFEPLTTDQAFLELADPEWRLGLRVSREAGSRGGRFRTPAPSSNRFPPFDSVLWIEIFDADLRERIQSHIADRAGTGLLRLESDGGDAIEHRVQAVVDDLRVLLKVVER